MNVCSIDGCGFKVDAHGYCSAHYKRWKRYGDPLNGPPMRARAGSSDAFIAAAIMHKGEECLFWPYARNSAGYGHIGRKKGFFLIHRIVCEAVNGAAPEGRPEAAHECGNGHLGCVNPKHLSWKSRGENVQDMLRHGKSQTGSKQHMAKLNDAAVMNIRCSNETNISLAERYGVSSAAISYARNRKTWRHVSP